MKKKLVIFLKISTKILDHKNTIKFKIFLSGRQPRLPDDEIEYIEKLSQNKKFKFFCVFIIHKN